jgi:3-phenylpropionate/cinnamic acid dioxygenase small subunit
MNVEDTLAIHELLARYGHVLDNRAWSQLGDVFADDARYDVTDVGWGLFDGLESIKKFLMVDARHPLGHHTTNVVIEPIDDDQATVRSKGVGVFPDRTSSVVYVDTVRRTPDGWRFASRQALARRPDELTRL